MRVCQHAPTDAANIPGCSLPGQACPLGSFTSHEGAASCQLCPPGSHWDGVGQTSASGCKPCKPGTIASKPGAITCEACRPGSYWNGAEGRNACQACLAGTASSLWAAQSRSACKQCTAGWYAEHSGSMNCKVRPADTWPGWGPVLNCLGCFTIARWLTGSTVAALTLNAVSVALMRRHAR